MIDPEQISGLIAMARGGASMVKDASGAAQAVRDLFKGDKVDPAAARASANDLLDQLVTLRLQQLDMIDCLARLQEEARMADELRKERARYELFRTPAGNYVLQVKFGMANDEPHHYACPNCFEDGKRSILQEFNTYFLKCQRCKSVLQNEIVPPQTDAIGVW